MARPIIPDAYEGEFHAGSYRNAMKAAEAKAGDRFMVPLKALKVLDGFNIRVRDTARYKAGIQSLADSIKSEGFYPDKPLGVFVDAEGDICVTDGHRRLEAAILAVSQGAEIEALPVVVKPQGTSREDLTVALVRSNTGEPLTPLEIGIVVKRLLSYGMEKAAVCQRLQITERYVDDLLLLVAAPKAVRDMVAADKVSATLAIDALRADPKGAAETLREGLASAEAKGKGKVTKKHLKDKLKSKAKKKGKKVAEEAPETAKDSANDNQPAVQVLPEAKSRLAGNLDALEVVDKFQEKMPDLVDEMMKAVISVAGQDELVALAIETERYENTGLVRLGMVELKAEGEGGDAPDAAADL